MDDILNNLFSMIDEAREEIITLHQDLVRIPTINTGDPLSGNEIEACKFLEQRFHEAGITCEILESHPGRGNILAHFGENQKPRLLLMSHLDVVPVDEKQWSVPPFSGEIQNGKIYGRGSDDAKSLVTTGAMTLILLKRAGIRLKGELLFLASADEEAGGNYGIKWLVENHPQKIVSDWAVNEGGGEPLFIHNRLAYFLSLGEKGRYEAKFKISGRSGHGARPWLADNAIYNLNLLIEAIRSYHPDLYVENPTFEMLKKIDICKELTPEEVDVFIESSRREYPFLALLLTALSRMTIAPTIATAGNKSNSIPSCASLICDVRTLPHQTREYVEGELQKIVGNNEKITFHLEETANANKSPFEDNFVSHLLESTVYALGKDRITFIPSLTTGFTDSRYVRLLGTKAYGYAPLVPGSDVLRPGIHGIDESMEIENLIFRIKFQVALTYLTMVKPNVTATRRFCLSQPVQRMYQR